MSSFEPEASGSIRIPLSRIKKIMRMDAELGIMSQDGVFCIGKATEIFLGHLANVATEHAKKKKRKTIQVKDIEEAIQQTDNLQFLDGTLDISINAG